jgi:uncharacterized membrane protein YfcA
MPAPAARRRTSPPSRIVPADPALLALLAGPLDWSAYGVAFLVIVVAAVAQSALGIGFGIVAAPVLAVIDPALVPGTVMILGALTAFVVAVRERAGWSFANLGYALAGRVLFSLVGALVASLLPPRLFLLVFAGLILAAVALSLSGLRVAPSRRNLFLAGSASGFMGTLTAVGTPPLAIVYQYAPGAEVRATLSAFFAVGGLISILSLTAFGQLGLADLTLSLALLPAMLLGYLLSPLLARHTDRGWMRPAMLALCVGAAGLLLAEGVAGLAAEPQADVIEE